LNLMFIFNKFLFLINYFMEIVMKKYFMFCAMSLALCTTAQAVTSEELDEVLDDWQKKHSIIAQVREDSAFNTEKNLVLENLENPSAATPKIVLKEIFKKVIRIYIKETYIDNKEFNSKYFTLVEGLPEFWCEHITNKN
jgi:hypothetical protein